MSQRVARPISTAYREEDEFTAQIGEIEIIGYRVNEKRRNLIWILSALSAFTALLVFYWRPDWWVRLTHEHCSVARATVLLVRNQYNQIFVRHIQQCSFDGQAFRSSDSSLHSLPIGPCTRLAEHFITTFVSSSNEQVTVASYSVRSQTNSSDVNKFSDQGAVTALLETEAVYDDGKPSNAIRLLGEMKPAQRNLESSVESSSECVGYIQGNNNNEHTRAVQTSENAEKMEYLAGSNLEDVNSSNKIVGTKDLTKDQFRIATCKDGQCNANGQKQTIRYFVDRNVKYIFDEEAACFKKATGLGLDHAESQNTHFVAQFEQKPTELTGHTFHSELAAGVNWHTRMQLLALYGRNSIEVQLTPILKLLFLEVLHPFYLFQLFACVYWYVDKYELYATAILLTSLVSISLTTYRTRRVQKNLRNMLDKEVPIALKLPSALKEMQSSTGDKAKATKCGNESDAQFRTMTSSFLVPGDVIEVPQGGCSMQCDAVLISGQCVVNESRLTGESVPVTKTPIVDADRATSAVPCGQRFTVKTHSKHVLFGGTTVIQTRSSARERVLAVVIRTGFMTSKGELIRSILHPKPIDFKFIKQAFRFVLVQSMLALAGVLYTMLIMMVKNEADFADTWRHVLNAIVIAVPPTLPAVMTVGVLFALARLKHYGVYCISPNSVVVSGGIDLVCLDKTGTLTENDLDLHGLWQPNDCATLCETNYSIARRCNASLAEESASFGDLLLPADLLRLPKSSLILEALASCHSLTKVDGHLCGDPLEIKQFESLQWDLHELDCSQNRNEAAKCLFTVSPNAKQSHCYKTNRFSCMESSLTESPQNDSFVDNVPYEIGIIRQLVFCSTLKRSSVIVRVAGENDYKMFVKGAPELLATLCRNETVPSAFESLLSKYTRKGYRVLAFAHRSLPAEQFSHSHLMQVSRETLECQLDFLGLLIFENRLKAQTRTVIQDLQNCNIRTVMVTGDNLLTALSVARESCLLTSNQHVVVVSAADLQSEQDQKLSNRNSDSVSTSVSSLLRFHSEDGVELAVKLQEDTSAACQLTATNGSRSSDGWHSPESCKLSEQPEETQVTIEKCYDATLRQSHVRFAITGDAWLVLNQVLTRYFNKKSPSVDTNTPLLLEDDKNKQSEENGQEFAETARLLAVMNTVLSKLVLCARMLPDQKQQLVQRLQSAGHCVAMCGDGANDASALQTAHVGISLSEAEASIAAPFTSKQANIQCVPTVIREGRSALVTSFSVFKFLACYSLTQFITVMLLYYFKMNLGDKQYFYIDIGVAIGLSITIGRSESAKSLSRHSPSGNLVNLSTIGSLITQLSIVAIVQITACLLLQAQPFYVVSQPDYEEHVFISQLNTVLFTVSIFQYEILALVCAKGRPHHAPVHRNYCFVALLVLLLAINSLVLCQNVPFLLAVFDLAEISSWRFKLLLALLILAHFLLACLVERVFDMAGSHHVGHKLLVFWKNKLWHRIPIKRASPKHCEVLSPAEYFAKPANHICRTVVVNRESNALTFIR